MPQSHKGFTLIELLVVISIIGTLSSIVLASLSSARTKAQNAAILVHVHSLLDALTTYNLDHNDFPHVSAATINYDQNVLFDGNGFACFGQLPGNASCGGYPYDATLNAALSPYMSSMANPDPYPDDGGSRGAVYECVITPLSFESNTSIKCDFVTIVWYMIGTNEKCPPFGDRTVQIIQFGVTQCNTYLSGVIPVS